MRAGVTKSKFNCFAGVLLAWCLPAAPVLGQALNASATGLVDINGDLMNQAEVTSIQCKDVCEGTTTVCTTDLDCGGGTCDLPSGCPHDNPVGVRTVIDKVLNVGPGFGCTGIWQEQSISTIVLFSWFSVTELPGDTFFPKIFAGIGAGENEWQTISSLQVAPGIVRVQNVWFRPTLDTDTRCHGSGENEGELCNVNQECLPPAAGGGVCIGGACVPGGAPCNPDIDCPGFADSFDLCTAELYCADVPELGPMNFFNALAWSANLSEAPARGASIERGSLKSSVSVGPASAGSADLETRSPAAFAVRLESSVEPLESSVVRRNRLRRNLYRYDYVFENLTGETVTVTWDSAGLTRTLAPFETLVVTDYSVFPAVEAQGYAHVTGDELTADMVSMALVPGGAASGNKPERGGDSRTDQSGFQRRQ